MTTTTEPDSYKNYKYTEKEYYRLYNKQLWDEKLGVSSPCERCGRCVRLGHMRRHHKTNVCSRVSNENEIKLTHPHSERLKALEHMVKELQGKF